MPARRICRKDSFWKARTTFHSTGMTTIATTTITVGDTRSQPSRLSRRAADQRRPARPEGPGAGVGVGVVAEVLIS